MYYAHARTLQPVAHVIGGRVETTGGGTRAIIRIDGALFGAEATKGLEEFSHLEVVFHFHLTDKADLPLGARRPRNNPDWPEVGTFGHRNMRRPQLAGRISLPSTRGRWFDLHVEDLDAVDGTPVLDIKPWFADFGPRGPVRQPAWPTEMPGDYFAPHS